MARLVQNYGIFINAEPTAVYDYLADFTKHGEWSEGLNVEAVSEGPTEVGSEFKSVGKQFGKDVANDIKVIEAQRPSRLAFVASADGTDFLQEIDLSESGGGTPLRRRDPARRAGRRSGWAGGCGGLTGTVRCQPGF